MLTGSAAFNTALSANNRMWQIKVTVTRDESGSTPIDISDRIISCDIDIDWNKRNAQSSLEIDNYDYSLSPVNQASTTNQVGGVYDPLFDSNHVLEVWEGLLTTNGYEYIKRFTGVLGDEIDADSYPGVLQITCRDKSKLLQDTYIYQSKTYTPVNSATLPLPEYVIQDLINTFLPSGGITVNVIDPTNFVVGKPDQPYTAKDTNLWDAIQLLSDAFNFCIMFDEYGSLNLKKIVRDLSTVTPVYTFDETKLTKDRVSTNDSNVRNHIKLRVQGLNDIEKMNQASINRYGRRYMEVHRTLSYLITTADQAGMLVDNMLKDLSYVTPVDSLEMPLFPLIQVGDIVSLVNTKLGTTAQAFTYRVISVKESFSKDKKRTSIDVQGYNNFNPDTVPAPNMPTGLSATLTSRSIQNYPNSGWNGYTKSTYFPLLSWTPPALDASGGALTNDFGGYIIYRQGPGDVGFYALANITSYINLPTGGKVVNYFYDYTAASGTNQYKIAAVNKYGTASAQTAPITIIKSNDLIT
jgi:hypothetical protein